MNLGNIPGFYFDPQKKRYFKITDGARLPPSVASQAVYEHGHYQRHERDLKRAKTQQSIKSRVQQQRVKRAGILGHSTVSGMTLSRASGNLLSSAHGSDASTALVGHYELIHDVVAMDTEDEDQDEDDEISPSTYFGPLIKVLASPETQTLVQLAEDAVRLCQWDQGDIANVPQEDPRNITRAKLQMNVETMALHRGDPYWMIVCPQAFTHISSPQAVLIWQTNVFPKFVYLPSATNDSAIHKTTISKGGRLAMAFDCGLYTTDDFGDWSRCGGSKSTHHAQWLGEHTIVGTRKQKIHLFDLRSDGTRLRTRGEHNITGIQCVPGVDWQFVASTNRSIKLYDLRMISEGRDRFTLDFAGEHAGTHSRIAVSSERLLAAWQDDQVKVMSLKSGRFAQRMDLPYDAVYRPAPPTQIAWSADRYESPYLYGCFYGKFLRWSASPTYDSD